MKLVVIGGGLTGLSLVHWLHQNHHEVVLLEATEKLGGRFRNAGQEASEFGYIVPSESSLAALEWLKSVSPAPFNWNEVDLQPLQFESNEWRPFLGFGDFPSSVVDELAFLSPAKHWRLDPGFDQVVRAMIEQLPIEARTLTEVTGLEAKDGRIRFAVVNGQEKIAADEFIFCSSPRLLNNLLPPDVMKPAHRSRLAKMPDWTAVSLTLNHREPIAASSALRFVLGTGKEFEPVVGRVAPLQSTWINLVSNAREEDLEHVGDCVRFIRRTVKRVYPELLDLASEEKIRVRPHALGKIDLKLKNGLSFPELPNLHMADARMSQVPGDLSTAAIASQLARLFVAQPQKPVLSESEAVIT